MHNSHESNAIRQQMEEVRRDLDQDVQEIVEGARDMGKWRSYVRDYPWACVGAAVAVGYLLIPRRRVATQQDTAALAEVVQQSCLATKPHLTAIGKARGLLLGCVGNLVTREVSSYVGQQTRKLFHHRPAVHHRTVNDEEPNSQLSAVFEANGPAAGANISKVE